MYLTQIQVKRDLLTENRGLKSSFYIPSLQYWYTKFCKSYKNVRFHKKDSPLNKKSYNICTNRQWQCDDFNFVCFCISDELFSAMIICPGTIHSEILNTDVGFQINSCIVEKVIIIPYSFSMCVCLDSFIHRFVWRSWYIFWFSKFFMVLRIWEF